ncbi:MAG: class I adenylate-forming enzyme family protein [Syntrophotaleaceae bacterium]
MVLDNPTLIHHFLENSARRWPDKIALVHEEVRATYGEINDGANRLARFLAEQGVVPGDRVVLLLENSLEYVVGYYGALKAGAVSVPMNTELKPAALQSLLERLEAKCLFSSRKFERLLRAVDLPGAGIESILLKDPKLGLNQAVEVMVWDAIACGKPLDNPDLDLAETALGSIIFTSGSTGRPKGVMLTHRNIVANVKSICQYLELTDADVQMVVQPFFYVMGKSLLNTHFAVGGRIVINNKFAYPATVISQMIEEQVTGFSGVPSTYAHLLHQSPLAASREKLNSLRYCSQAGGHMASAIKQRLLQVLPAQTRLYVMYGATEASARLSYVAPEMLERKIDSIGQAIPGVTLKVIDASGFELPLGDVGEIVATGENIMQGYWRDPDATACALSEHGYHTGDLGYCDQDGYFYVVGRKDNQLKVGGHRINTQEIEDVIMATGLVVEVAVIGLPDVLLENRLMAVVVPVNSELNGEALLSLCAQNLPVYKRPQGVLLVKNLPKSASGKLDRKKCEDLVGSSAYVRA